MTNFGQIITAMVTPFKAENKHEIDFAATERLIEHLVNNGSDSIIISGTTGESPTLSHDEEVELFLCAQKKVKELGSNTKIIFGAGSNCTQTSIRMSLKAQELGADGLLIVTPYYNKPNQKGLLAHFSLIAEATSLPIILYNVPSRTNISLKAETIIELNSRYPHICSLKEASSNIDIITQLRSKLKAKDFSIYSGDDSLTLPMLAVGADGVISVAAHLVGNQMQVMIRAFKAGDHTKAQEIQAKLMPLFDTLFIEPNPTCIKEALGIIGMCSAILREPLVPLSQEQRQDLKKTIESLQTVLN
ncbi:MAG: 4-hydroxy-tetrahydrodipicolinate synthase [Cyanobacteria bacterium]|nr:4-hydroxy-tetrahydrodipicolinate synthase [Cyanobacteriota bacterium]MDA1020860.1 4-hydroxy-tetrahydrodipicolinate synthase [Cyanobacteriota bacterium]